MIGVYNHFPSRFHYHSQEGDWIPRHSHGVMEVENDFFGNSTPGLVFHLLEGKSAAALGVGSYVKISTFGGLPKNKIQ